METRDVLLAGTVFLAAAAAGLVVGFQFLGQDSRETAEPRTFAVGALADGENDVATARFDNQSINLLFEDEPEARMFLDLDGDGGFEIELDDLNRSGTEQQNTETVNLGNRSYRLLFEYRDDPEETGEAYLNLRTATRLE